MLQVIVDVVCPCRCAQYLHIGQRQTYTHTYIQFINTTYVHTVQVYVFSSFSRCKYYVFLTSLSLVSLFALCPSLDLKMIMCVSREEMLLSSQQCVAAACWDVRLSVKYDNVKLLSILSSLLRLLNC